MKTFKQLQNLLTENKNNKKWDPNDPAGVPDFVFKSAHEKIQYKREMMPLWKKLNLPTDFEERINAMGGKTMEYGFNFGKRGRGNDLPDFVTWSKNGQKDRQFYYKNGKLHRDGDKPAMILWYENEQKQFERHYKNGKEHRDGDKPAEVEWHKNGQKHAEWFYKNGNKHRDGDKPAVTRWHGNGKKEREKYYKNGKEHRDDFKPAIIIYKFSGSVDDFLFYENGFDYMLPNRIVIEMMKKSKSDEEIHKALREHENMLKKLRKELKH